MAGRITDITAIPAALWQRAEMINALRKRDIGQVFQLVQKYTGMSQTRMGIACELSQPKVSELMRGLSAVEELAVFERIANGLDMPDAARAALGLAPVAGLVALPGQAIPSGDARRVLAAAPTSGVLGASPDDSEEDDGPVRRRTFVGLTGASLFSAVLADEPAPDDGIQSVAAALTSYAPLPVLDAPPDMAALAARVARAKRDYQACKYAEVTRELPGLLTQLRTACAALDDSARLRALTLSAEAHHVAASVMLKAGDQGLGWMAADRSMQGAQASGDPVAVGSSARIVTHAMMSSGHLGAASSLASSMAASLDSDITTRSPEWLSVYGSLLLRGAVAAAQAHDRRTASELLDEAGEAAEQLGEDLNLRWTAFGPTNARLHRVNIAVTLGDAGTAVDVARTVDLARIDVNERRAVFLTDTARALLQCGKHERAYLALRAADQIAPEEIRGRRAAQRIIMDLMTTAPPSIQRQAADFARLIGMPQ